MIYRAERGRILVDEGFTVPEHKSTIIRYWYDDKYEEIVVPPVDHYQRMVENFANHLIHGESLQYPVQDAVKNMSVFDRVLRKSRRSEHEQD